MTEEEKRLKASRENRRDLEAELKEERDRYDAQNQEAYDKEVSGENFLKDRAKEDEEEIDGGKLAQSIAFEASVGLATDIATTKLMALPPLYALANFVSGATANLIAQKIRGESKLSIGEILASGGIGIIPGTTIKTGKQLSKVVGKAGTVKRGAIATGLAGVGSEAIRIGIDEQRLLNVQEALTAGTLGGVTGASLQKILNASPALLKRFNNSIPEPEATVPLGAQRPALAQRIDATDLPDADEVAARTEMLLTRDADNLIAKDLPKGAAFDNDAVKDYAKLAYRHRKDRIVAGGKQNLMKDFDQTITNKSGQEFIFVKRTRLRNRRDPAAIENYKLTSVADVERKLIRSLGFDKQIPEDVKALKIIVRELNKLEQQNPKLYLSSLMEYGDSAYLEHKVARSQFEDFWARVEARNPDDIANGLFQWTGASGRNTVENLRLLFDPNYKKLKDATETRFINSKLYKSAKGRKSQPDDIVITIEDPGSTTFGANNMFVRSNPGNIQFRKAGTGEVVGSIPDYYRQFYSTAFKEGYNKNYGFLANPNNPAVPPKFRARAGESVDEYIERVINERIDEAMSGSFDMQNFEANYLEEIAQFYDLFHDKLGWVRLPSWADNIITGKTKFADRLQVEIDDFEIENAPSLPVVAPKTLKQSNLEQALQEIKSLEEDIRKLPREPVKLPEGQQGFTPDTQVIDPKTGQATGQNYGVVQSNMRKIKRELQERIDEIKAEYGIDQAEDFTQQSLDLE